MTTSEQSQQSDLFPMELESMSLQADSRAKTSHSQEIRQALRASAVDSGQSAPVFLGSFSPNTPSLKTSQTCLMENGELGLSEFSGTFPRSGMMRSGTVYQLPNLARTITEIGCGLWRTPAAANGQQGAKSKVFYLLCKKTGQSTITLVDEVRHATPTSSAQEGGSLNPTWVEWLMGFPLDHTDLNA